MKFQVTMKDPDAPFDAIDEALVEEVDKIVGLDTDERHAVIEERGEKVRDLCEKWFRYGELLTVEIDTDAQTCTVVENDR
jgi:hypothetical protein